MRRTPGDQQPPRLRAALIVGSQYEPEDSVIPSGNSIKGTYHPGSNSPPERQGLTTRVEERATRMLILAEGTIQRPIPDAEHTAVKAWFGPMIDGGFMQTGYVDAAGGRCWMLLSSPTLADAQQRLGDLPVVQDGSVSFTTTKVSALRFE